MDQEIEDGEYYWVLAKDGDEEWEVGQAQEVRKMGFVSKGFIFMCSISGNLPSEAVERFEKIERTYVSKV